MIAEKIHLPLHKAWKAAQFVNQAGKVQMSPAPIAWKFETFIFDWLLYAHRVAALIYPREECFAPLKNLTGDDSPETVRDALQQRERAILERLTGLPPPPFSFELPAEFYYPTQELKTKWKGKHAVPSDFA